jgi:inhibitor of cysteine peptidase
VKDLINTIVTIVTKYKGDGTVNPYKSNRPKYLIVLITIVLLATSLLFNFDRVTASNTTANSTVSKLPAVKSMDHLRKLLSENSYNYRTMAKNMAIDQAIPAPASQDMSQSKEFSSTNVQVAGVDEADLIKTDGTFIYQINNNALIITKAVPADQMQVMSRLDFSNDSFYPVDFYITDTRLVLIGTGHTESYINPRPIMPLKEINIMPPYYREETARAIVYDMSDKTNLVKTRELELKGNYLTSRRIGQTVYLISNDYLNYYPGQEQEVVPLPAYRDSAANNVLNDIACEKINYFPNCTYNSYIITAALPIDQPNQPAQVNSYLGSAENVYASLNNLYIAIPASAPQVPVVRDSAVPEQSPSTVSTRIYRFSLKDKQINYSGAGTVPGRVLNQFSMDEYDNHFRIATTSEWYDRKSGAGSSNNIYVLDNELKIKGKIEMIAPGEQIYSARFMGKRAYMVTFRTVDPLFVIDLSDPAKPGILGKLKIPGYSNYLHPYDENHIIGIGKDTIEMKGYGDQPQAFYLGIKVALFDVTDYNNPVEMDKVIIGDRGTESEVLQNHRALLFSREKNLLAFPITLAQVDKSNIKKTPGSLPAYGSFAFQGAYIYNISLDGGLRYKGRISHLSQEDYLKAGDYWSNPDSSIQRILYLGNNLYTVSNQAIMANQLSDLKPVGSIRF